MTTLAEREKIERDSRSDPNNPGESTEAEVIAARALLARIRSGVLQVAVAQLPEDGVIPPSGISRDAIAWGRDVLRSPDTWAADVLRTLLARFSTLSVAQLAGVTDQQIIDAVADNVPALAVGRDVRRPG